MLGMVEQKQKLHPLRFEPVYQNYLWGGRRIADQYGRTPPGGACAESWEVSDRDDGMSVVAEGPLAGTALRGLMQEQAEAILGPGAVPGQRFPLLVKILDAHQDLSVQVHPDDQTAAAVGGEAKSEMWFLLDAAAGAAIYRGLKPGTTREGMEQALAGGDPERVLIRLPVSRDDAVYIPGGTVHAIGAGCLILEVQQNSNTTYRIHDWGRTGPDGKPRDVHLDQAAKVIHWSQSLPDLARPTVDVIGEGYAIERVLATEYFTVGRLRVDTRYSWAPDSQGMAMLFVQEGTGQLTAGDFEAELKPGCTWLIPACLDQCEVIPCGEAMRLVTISLP